MTGWTHAEEEALRILANLGCKACAEAFERSPKSVEWKADQLGISLKRSSQGKSRENTCSATFKRIRALALAPLCPACGVRPVSVKRTGLCGRCHLEGLKAVHEEESAKLDAQRALWASRSRLQRRRRAVVTGVCH